MTKKSKLSFILVFLSARQFDPILSYNIIITHCAWIVTIYFIQYFEHHRL